MTKIIKLVLIVPVYILKQIFMVVAVIALYPYLICFGIYNNLKKMI